MREETSITGSIPVKGCNDINRVVNRVLKSVHGQGIRHAIAYDEFRPKCRIGMDEKGVAIFAILRSSLWKIWRRSDIKTYRVYDSHSAGPVYGFCPGAPRWGSEYILSPETIEYCKNAYSVSMGVR